MSDSIPMLFEVCNDRPIPRLLRDAKGEKRVADGTRFLSLEQAAARFKMPPAELEKYWLDVWDDLIDRDFSASLKPENAASAQLDILHAWKYPELCDEHFAQLVSIAAQLGFNLWNREIYGKIVHDPISNRPEMVPVVGIYGLRRKAHDTHENGGSDVPIWEPSEDERRPAACRVTVYRLVNGQRQPHPEVALWDECAPEPGVSEFWDKQPYSALEQRAEAKALRKAFSEVIGGVYLPDEIRGDRQARPGQSAKTPPPPHTPGEEPPTTQIGFEIAAKEMGFADPCHRSHVIAMLKSKFGGLFDHDERAFWERAFRELRGNPRKYAPPSAM